MEELPAGYLRHGQERLPSMALGCRENRTESQLEAKDSGAWGGLEFEIGMGFQITICSWGFTNYWFPELLAPVP